MQRIGAGIAVLTLLVLGDPVAAGPADDAVRKFGILGTWAVDCSRPRSSTNPYQTYAIGTPYPTRTLAMETKGLDGVFDMRKVRLAGSNRLAYTDVKQGGADKHFDVVLEIVNGRMRSLSSVANDGEVIIKDGKFVGSGAPTLVFQRCLMR
jgi:hypothetical protein